DWVNGKSSSTGTDGSSTPDPAGGGTSGLPSFCSVENGDGDQVCIVCKQDNSNGRGCLSHPGSTPFDASSACHYTAQKVRCEAIVSSASVDLCALDKRPTAPQPPPLPLRQGDPMPSSRCVRSRFLLPATLLVGCQAAPPAASSESADPTEDGGAGGGSSKM